MLPVQPIRSRPFVCRCLSSSTLLPFPRPADRTRRAARSRGNSLAIYFGSMGCAVKVVDLQWVQLPPGIWVAPAGSYRSGGGGNEAAGAFETTGDSSRSASGQAITRVNVEQASKRMMWEPTRPHCGEGRRRGATEGVKDPPHERSNPAVPPG